MTRTCQSRYGGEDCTRPAVWLYRGIDYQTLLCQECAARLCDMPDMPHVGEMIRSRLSRLEGTS